ncbi:heme ABC exporter ATP-binding protein CcmA [Roseibium polysiphoniae]|uniref:heme ABC exporter ATP-binding protein CcmA n=1 Tax=Roseibium polysiphoniae TaxID=2571221 RepID=UPI003299672F
MKLIADNLAVDRGDRRVFAGLSFSLESGNALVVTGPNGVGKSSLLRTLAGLVSLSEGSLNLQGGQSERSVAEHAHYFGHQSAVKPALSVKENLAFWRDFTAPAHTSNFDPKEYGTQDILEELGIGHTSELPAAYLSAGQTRRLAVARLFVSQRPIWLLDEPTSALDANSEAQLIDLMNDHLRRGGMIATATHAPLSLSPLQSLRLEALSIEDLAPLEEIG